jgi:hypothetical protein
VADFQLAQDVSGKRPLFWMALLCIAPFVASFALYFWMTPTSQMNYGTLLAPVTLPAVPLQSATADPLPANVLRGKWTLVFVDAAGCAERCMKKLYATRQARTMQGKERERVARLWLVTGDGGAAAAANAEVIAQHPELMIAKADPALIAALPGPGIEDSIFLVDPLGNLVLRYPADPDIKRVHKDIARLLYSSRIG